MMRLFVTTPTTIVVDAPNVGHVRAEDETGAFGILPRHADFMTTLSVSVLSYRDEKAVERFVALRGGVLRVRGGNLVEVATSEAVAGDDLAALKDSVLVRYATETENERAARTHAARLHVLAVRGIYRYLQPEKQLEEISFDHAMPEEIQ